MIRHTYTTKPHFEHDCFMCTFMYGIETLVEEFKEDGPRVCDVYESCDINETSYIIRYSNLPDDYEFLDLRAMLTN